jgi:protein KRI1
LSCATCRFEEPGADRIITHPRTIGDSVRKADEKRRRQREAKAARKAAEREAQEAQLKRLKNMKKQEIEDK